MDAKFADVHASGKAENKHKLDKRLAAMGVPVDQRKALFATMEQGLVVPTQIDQTQTDQ